MKEDKYFNIRVYALLYNEHQELLIAQEFHYNTFMQKFPGGGLQFGESISDCLRRELKEELSFDVDEMKHFYTTDQFVQSAFNSNHQVIGIYFIVKASNELSKQFRNNKEFLREDGQIEFSWIPIDTIKVDDFTFAIDKQVVKILLEKLTQNEIDLFK